MMVPFSTLLSNHIRFLLQSLDGSNSDSVFRDLCEFTEYGAEGSILLLRTCLDHIDIYGTDLKNINLDPAVVSVFKYLLEKPNFSTLFCQSVKSEAIRDGFLDNLSNAFCLSVSEKIALSLALSDSENAVTRKYAKNFCMAQIEDFFANPSVLGSTEQIQQILMFLHQSEDLSKHVDTFVRMLSLLPLQERFPSILAALTSNESECASLLRNLDFLYDCENDFDAVVAEMDRETNLADVIKELGYGCTDDVKNCKCILALLSPLTESTISRIIGTVACTHGGILESQNAYPVFLSATGYGSATDLPALTSWNINILVDSIKELVPDTNWVQVMENLDYEGFCIPDEAAFNCLMSIYKLACQDPFPLHSICGSIWKNAEGQLSFLKHAVSSPTEVFTFAHSTRQLELFDSIQGLKLQRQLSNHAWLCVDLLDVLCQLAERGYTASVQSMLEYPLKHCPELLLLGLAQIETAYNLIQYEISLNIFPRVICSTSNSRNGIVMQTWHFNPLLLVRVIVEALTTDADNIARVVDVCHEIKILDNVLKMIPFTLAIRLAVTAFRKELLDLEKWLNDNLIAYRDTFFEESLRYLKGILSEIPQQEKTHHSVASLNTYSQTVAVFLKVLQANSHSLSSSFLCDEMNKLSITLRHGTLGQDHGNADVSAAVTYDDDIESEANSYFQRMFLEQLTVSEMVQMLSCFKDSSDSREKSIFECVINNLFEEYSFFHKYPEKQLGLTAVLFGSLIKNQLVTHLTLGIAIRNVLDALRKPADSKMFGFGTKALEQFINRLDEWPQYCNHILQISHLRGTHPELVAYIEGVLTRRSHGGTGPLVDHVGMSTSVHNVNEFIGSNIGQPGQQSSTSVKLQSGDHNSLDDENGTSANTSNFLKPPPSPATQSIAAPSSEEVGNQKLQNAVTAPTVLSSSLGVARQSRGITSTRFGSAMNIETLLSAAERRETPIEAPAPEVQDKVSFTINNLSAANIEAKAKEFAEILKEQYYPWFAQYMVMKRASIEPNFHELYLKFLEKANSKALTKEIVQATYENCKVLLGSELIKSSSEERSLLKNLGSWLGKLTIGRNQFLRARDIDPKSLIIEAYEKGLMIAVIPFTSKILEPCQSSLAYQPPNPWTMGILSLLAEIYAMPNLKMNLKFDIEVLFKNLGVNMKDVTPRSLLKDRVRVVEGNPDFSNKDMAVPHPPVDDKPGIVAALNQLELPLEVAGPSHLGGHAHSMSSYGASARSLIEDEKLAALGFPDQLPAAQGLLPSAASQSPFINQLSAIASITQHIVVNPKISAMGLHPHFQRALPIAIERAINEIVPGIVQRSVSIAIQTTKELVIKDYALESDESRIYTAAHLMVGSLAGSLAHVTCKEPLRASMASQLRNMLQGLNIANELLETAILNATNDNLDLGCAHIENSAAEKAVEMVDADIGQQLALRRKQSLGPSMYDASGFTKGPMSILAETLQPKPGRVSLSQQRVYEDFVRLPWQNQQTSPSTNSTLTGPSLSAGVSLPRPFNSSSGQLNPGVYSSGIGNTGHGGIAQPLGLASDEIDTSIPQIFSASSNQGRITDAAVQQRADMDATMAPSTAHAIPELLPGESSIPLKDMGTPSQTLSLPFASERIGTGVSEPLFSTGDALDKYQMVASKLEALLANDGRETDIQSTVSEVPQIILRCVTRDEAALAVAQKVFKALYDNSSNSLRVGAYLAILAAIRDVCKLVVKELTSRVIHSDEERRFNRDITVGLIRRELISLAEYNIHMAKLLDAGRNKAATEFAISLIQTLLIEEPKVLSELHSVVDTLAKLAARPGSPESLQQLVDIAKNPSANVGALSSIISGMDDKSRQTKDKKVGSQAPASRGEYNHVDMVELDSPGFHEQVSLLFEEWFRICELPATNVAAVSSYILQLHHSGLLKGDDTSDRFFRMLLELSVSHCLTTEVISTQNPSQQAQPLSFLAIDIYAKLVSSVLKYCPVEQGSSKLFLLPKILAVAVRYIQKDADEKKSSFNARPYFRLFINWLLDIGSLEPIHDGVNLQVLSYFTNAFHSLQPLKVPAFSFAWLELVTHRTFMPKLLTGNSQKGWPLLHRLLVDLFQFMEPFLRNAELGEAIHVLYRGTLRVLLVLLHDFPEFLCDYHFSFCDVIPPSCIQMRNIVLSAFPRNMRLPDPSTPNLKIDLLVEMSQSPRILSEVDAALRTKQMKADVDEYLKTRQQQGSSFLTELKQKLLLSQNEASRAGTRYNVPLINSLVLYVGIQATAAIQQLQARTSSQPQSMSNNVLVDAALEIFHALITELDTEGRYLFLNAIANQLRYPNNHTHYFSFILLYLFSEANQEIIQEQITRVLLERLIVNRPHPWGLLITFIELIKNPRYSFWSRSFTRCAPEIEKLFESVSRSCGGPKPVNDSMVGSGALSESAH